jgi:hypothetical protein
MKEVTYDAFYDAKSLMQYGVRPLPIDIRQKRSDPLLGKVFVLLFGPDLLGDGLDIFFVGAEHGVRPYPGLGCN